MPASLLLIIIVIIKFEGSMQNLLDTDLLSLENANDQVIGLSMPPSATWHW